MHFHNFDLWIDKGNRGVCFLRAASPLFGEVRGESSINPEEPETLAALTRLSRGEIDNTSLTDFGTKLYKLLFVGEIENLFHQCYGAVTAADRNGIRLRLRIESPAIASLPWEFLYSPSLKAFLATTEHCAVVRYLEIHQRIRSLEATLPLHMLVVIPENTPPYPPLDVQSEKSNINRALEGLKDSVRITILEGTVSLSRVSDALMDEQYHCFHFIGHGTFQDDRGSILMNSRNGGTDYVGEERFAGLFQDHPMMKLVVLNSCKGAEVSSVQPFTGMAPQLIRRGIPAVVAMQYSIYDDAAVLFAREFYRKLFRGWNTGRVDVALHHARNSLAGDFPGERAWGTPVLYLRSSEGVLFSSSTGKTFQDIPLSREHLDTLKSIITTYIDNTSIEETSSDREELARIRQRIRFRNYVVAGTTAVVLLMFFLSVVKAFDFFNLDTRVESYTMLLGRPFALTPFSDQIALITITDDSFGKSWRIKHGRLIEKLARAGARVIVFDVFFEETSEFDDVLATAIKEASQKGSSTVIAGIRDIEDDRPRIVNDFLKAGCHPGLACIGQRLGYARSATLVVLKNDKEIHSLALSAYAAFKNLQIDYVDLDTQYIYLREPGGRPQKMRFSEVSAVRKHQAACPLIEGGDKTVELLFELSALDILRAPKRQYDYTEIINQDNPAELEHFRNRIVLIGVNQTGDRHAVRQGLAPRTGVELHADAINALLKGTIIRPLSEAFQFFIMVIMGVFGAMSGYRKFRSQGRCRRLSFLVIPGMYVMTVIYVYAQYHMLLNTLYHIGAFFSAYWVTRKIEIWRFS